MTVHHLPEFRAWPKTPRLNRDIVITEKIDGTNAAVIIVPLDEALSPAERAKPGVFFDHETGTSYVVSAQSRKRIITPEADNFGFAKWVEENKEGLYWTLGAGYHYGEWWGSGIQRGYGQKTKRFSLFNVHRYDFLNIIEGVPGMGLVPVLYRGPFSEDAIVQQVGNLRWNGSVASPGEQAEGVIVYHSASKQVYKVLLENDDQPKGLAA